MKRRPFLMFWAAETLALILPAFAGRMNAGFDFTVFTVFTVFFTVAVIAAAVIFFKTGKRLIIALLPVFFVFCLFRFGMYELTLNEREKNAEETAGIISSAGAYGKVSKTEYKNEKYYLYIKDAKTYEDDRPIGNILILAESGENIEKGMTLFFKGGASVIPHATNPGQFDSAAYYKSQGILIRCIDPQLMVLKDNNAFDRLIHNIKMKLGEALYKMCGEDANVCAAMLLGEKGELDEDTKDLYKAGGISHLLAISGLHVSFIGMLIFRLLRLCRLGVVLSCGLSGGFVTLYAIMTGGSVSALRAAIMYVISLIARLTGRTYDMITGLTVAFCIVLLIYPGQVYASGFWLSFGAVSAFAIMMPDISKLFKMLKKHKKGRKSFALRKAESIKRGVLGSSAVSFFTMPILAWNMYVVNPLSLFLNILVIPLMTVIMINMLSVTAVYLVLRKAAALLTFLWLPGHTVLRIYSKACELSAGSPLGRFVTGRPAIWQMVIYLAALALLVLLIHFAASFTEKQRELKAAKTKEDLPVKAAFLIKLSIIPVLIALQLPSALILKRQKEDNTFIFLDVGQGDGMIAFSGDICMAIDGGSSFIQGIGTYRIEPAILYYGYDHVQYWFLTHPDTDHVSGIIDILTEKASPLSIEKVVIPTPSYGRAWNKVTNHLSPGCLVTMKAGDRITWPSGRLDILYPAATDTATDPNTLSFVINFTLADKSILLTGDIDSAVEQKLLGRYPPSALSATILKIPHHGSRFSSSQSFLTAVSPASAVISVGKNNYGHPSQEVLERLGELGIEVYITKEEGAIVLPGRSVP